MIYKFRNKEGNVVTLTEEEVKQLLGDNYGDMPDTIVIPKAPSADKDYFRIK